MKFVVMVSELNTDKAESTLQAEIIAEKIRSLLSKPYLLTKANADETDIVGKHRCTASIGLVLFRNHEESQDVIMNWADHAMYQAKEAGRNLILFHQMR